MPIDVTCPQCGSELEAPDEVAGKKVKCPDCGAGIPAPPGSAAVRPAPAPSPVSTARRADEEDEDRPRRRRRRDEDDDEDRPRRRRDAYEDDGVGALIPYKNGRALAAYYCGVFSLIPCLGLILGPIALLFGFLGRRYALEHPRAKGAGHAWAGIILGGLTTLANWGTLLGIVVLAITEARH